MKRYLILGLLTLTSLIAGEAETRAAVCPTTVNTNSDCGYSITFNADGTVSNGPIPGALPFDGGDDALIEVTNNTSSPIGSVTLSGTGNGGPIFGFDGDGICTFVTCNYPNPTTYEGPLNTFVNISPDQTTGTALFNGVGLASGATTYFSLEGDPQSIALVTAPVPQPPTPTPEPASLIILAFGLAVVITGRRYYI